jgi:hypothetical protein
MVNQLDLKTLYEQDFCQWIEATVDLLKHQQIEHLDYENLIEEIAAMGRSERNALASNLRILLVHLLKWKYQPNKRSRSWGASIVEHSTRLLDAFAESPSLKRYFEGILASNYQTARTIASRKTGLDINTFPVDLPFRIEDLLNSDYLPE